MSNLESNIFGKKKFSDLLKEIYDNQKKKEQQITALIGELKPLINDIGDATLIVPLEVSSCGIDVKLVQPPNIPLKFVFLAKLNADQDQYLKQLQPIVSQTAAINTSTKERIDNLKAEDKALKDSAKDGQQKYKEGWQGIISELKEFDAFQKANSAANQRAAAINAQISQAKALKARTEAQKKANEETKKAEDAALALAIAEGEASYQAPNFLEGFKNLGPKLIQETNAAAGLELFKNTFTNPLSDLFTTFLDTGKLAFKEFGKAILQTINQVVARIIATGIVNLLGSILFPGAPGATKGVGGAFKAAFGSILGINFGGGIAAPSFAGVGGGSLGMSGQVNLVLRGQDLVGSLNRTNTLINRVG